MPPHKVLISTPRKGDIVTFSFDSFARRDVPVNPTICKVRTDVVWRDLRNSGENGKHTECGKREALC